MLTVSTRLLPTVDSASVVTSIYTSAGFPGCAPFLTCYNLEEHLVNILLDLKPLGAFDPLCPVHEKPMFEDSPSAYAWNPDQDGPGPFFHCEVDDCGLHWSRQREHFDLREGIPAYTNCTSNTEMRCPHPGHGCLYIGRIDARKNRWSWNCAVCDYSYTDAPGAWVNPPTLL
jgi:hypothetical protein